MGTVPISSSEIAQLGPEMLGRMHHAVICELYKRGCVTAPELWDLKSRPFDDLLDMVFQHTAVIRFRLTDEVTLVITPRGDGWGASLH